MAKAIELRTRRKRRIRLNLKRKAHGRLRLSVHRSARNISVQIIDDQTGTTLAAASTQEKALRESLKRGGNKDAAVAVGKLIAERAKEKGLSEVVFDRAGYKYHGRVQALAEAAREGGLSF